VNQLENVFFVNLRGMLARNVMKELLYTKFPENCKKCIDERTLVTEENGIYWVEW